MDKDALSEDAKALFRQATEGTSRKPRKARHLAKQPAPKRSIKARENPISESLSSTGVMFDQTREDPIKFARVGLQHKVFRKLRRGDYGIAATLDLHGYTIAQARPRLSNFLTTARNARHSAILIVHGKGLHSDKTGGTLKQFTINWLKQRPAVKAFCSAQGKDGGTGALYVLLRPGKTQ